MAVKTDMSKAYDRIEWGFLRAILSRLGFHPVWINWIMECVSSVSYSFLINGSPRGQVYPTRGLRQASLPLSFYARRCSPVCRAQQDGLLSGIRASLQSPRVSHLLFADDMMFFCKANTTNSEALVAYGPMKQCQANALI